MKNIRCACGANSISCWQCYSSNAAAYLSLDVCPLFDVLQVLEDQASSSYSAAQTEAVAKLQEQLELLQQQVCVHVAHSGHGRKKARSSTSR
jgi:hypothetical protein